MKNKMLHIIWKKSLKYILIFIIMLLVILGQVMYRIGAEIIFTEKKQVALTFDDGPSKKYTEMLLDGLKKRNVHVTFFVMGKNIEGNEELLIRMASEGHLIGNHTYNHVKLNEIPLEKARGEIEKTNNKIFEITGSYPSYIRPPYGAWPKNLDLSIEMIPVFWNIDTQDWRSKDPEQILRIVEQQTRDGAVILMHDIYSTSVEAALNVIDELKKKGYEFVTVDKLIVE